MSAFYRSVESASEYIYGLGVKLEDYLFIEGDQGCNAKFYAWLEDEYDRSFADAQDDVRDAQDDVRDVQDDSCHVERSETSGDRVALFKSPFESRHPWISDERRCPSTITADPCSWIIYIPFDTCRFKLGGSLLAQANNDNGGKAPEISDPYYFIDCYEVVRELTEDGIIMAGATVADGGLMTAAARMCRECGCDLDISGLASSYGEPDTTKLLFGEVPGVIIQISDDNYDYVDAQLILQDVAYYPIGHPTAKHDSVKIRKASENGVAGILASLLDQASEGED
jgi:hypothetical protein